MTKTLISFLGRTPKDSGGYRTTTYLLNGQPQEPVAFIGYLFNTHYQPEKLVILGTTGSMWDHLFEQDLSLGSADEDERLALVEAVENKSVSQQQLDQLTPLLSQALNCQVELKIIPAATNEPEQLQLLQLLADSVDPEARLALDVTHGYRHLPMLTYTAALYLQTVKPSISIEHIWYGEYDSDEKLGYVHDLAGLLTVNRWMDAIRGSEATGDFTPVADLLEDQDLAEKLRNASFQENIQRASQARGALKKVRQSLKEAPLTGPAGLFQPLLEERTDWVDEDKLYQRQRTQALRSFERKDFLRATLFGFEAYITRRVQMEMSGGAENSKNRQEMQEKLKEDRDFKRSPEGQNYQHLRQLRNLLAHGDTATHKTLQQFTSSPENFEKELGRLLQDLLQE